MKLLKACMHRAQEGGKLGGGLDTTYASHCVVSRVDAGGPLAKQPPDVISGPHHAF